MDFMAFGLNHRTASIDVREQWAFTEKRATEAMRQLRAEGHVTDLSILSTCNRTEFYAQKDALPYIQAWLMRQRSITADAFEKHSYQHTGLAAITHLMRVASGLDSMVVGEPQILGQLKSAVQLAKEQDFIGKNFEQLFKQVFSVAKKVRHQTDIGKAPVSVAYAATKMAENIFASLKDVTVLLIGSGDTMRLTARHLCDKGVSNIYIANRSLENAESLAQEISGKALALSSVPSVLAQADIVVTATASTLPILGKGAVERAIEKRKHAAMFIVDLAVPRDVEPDVAHIDDIYLYTVDDLEAIIADSQHLRAAAKEEAEGMITFEAQQCERWFKQRPATDRIKHYREQIIQVRDAAVSDAIAMLDQGVPPEEVIEKLAYRLTNKLSHMPTMKLKHATQTGDENIVQFLDKVFELNSRS